MKTIQVFNPKLTGPLIYERQVPTMRDKFDTVVLMTYFEIALIIAGFVFIQFLGFHHQFTNMWLWGGLNFFYVWAGTKAILHNLEFLRHHRDFEKRLKKLQATQHDTIQLTNSYYEPIPVALQTALERPIHAPTNRPHRKPRKVSAPVSKDNLDTTRAK